MSKSKQLEQAIADSGKRTSEPMRRALRAILVSGETWRNAALRHGVTEGGILRAMRRLGLR